MCHTLYYLFDNIYIRVGTKCAPLVAELRLFYYERDFMSTLSDEAITEAFRYLDDLLNIVIPYIEGMGMFNQIYLPELQLNIHVAHSSDIEASCVRFTSVYFLTVLFHPNFMISAILILRIKVPIFGW